MDIKSILGYSKNSPFRKSPFLDIHSPEGLIDMSNTPVNLLGIDNQGNRKVMKAYAKNPYKFKGDVIREIPIAQKGGYNNDSILEFIFEEDEEVDEAPKQEINTTQLAPSTDELAQIQEERRLFHMEQQNALALEVANFEYQNFDSKENSTNNPYLPSVNNVPKIDVNQNAKFAFDFYTKKKGLAPHVAAGIVGNLMQESGLNPNAVGDGGKAKGLAQWHPDRFKNLEIFAAQTGRNPYDLEAQLDFVLNEPGEGKRVLNALQSAKNSGQAAIMFSKTYERPGKPEYEKRIGYAKSLSPYQLGGQYLNLIID